MKITKKNASDKNAKNAFTRGFTLIEAIVSIALFMVVMTVSTSALISIINANKQTHQIKTAMDNLNFALDSMTRDIRVGSQYRCGDGTTSCSDSGNSNTASFSYLSLYTGNTVIYSLSGSGQIEEQIGGSSAPLVALTDSNVKVTALHFYLRGGASGASDGQPAVAIGVSATVGSGGTATSFNLQTSVTQLGYDCNPTDACY